MDYISDSEFMDLHGKGLFEILALPMQEIAKVKDYNADANALVHQKIIDPLITKHYTTAKNIHHGKYWDKRYGRYSFVLFKEKYTEHYGEEEWGRLYIAIEMFFNQWLAYHKKGA